MMGNSYLLVFYFSKILKTIFLQDFVTIAFSNGFFFVCLFLKTRGKFPLANNVNSITLSEYLGKESIC